jgi:glycosyltransferase involved in cell wall biosynthesis
MNKPKISVIIPTYQPKDYIWECLSSVSNQTFPYSDYEVLIILNGCKEPHYSKIRDWMQEHSFLNINLIQSDQGGVSHARNIGIDEVKGDYVAFIDDDDYISPTYLQELFDIASDGCMAVSNVKNFYDDTREETDFISVTRTVQKCLNMKKVSINDRRRFLNVVYQKLIHRDVIGNRRFDSRFKLGEDSLFMFLISDKIPRRIVCTSENAIYYRRIREGSACTTKRSRISNIRNIVNLTLEYSKIFFTAPLKYSFRLYCLLMLVMIKNLFASFRLFQNRTINNKPQHV